MAKSKVAYWLTEDGLLLIEAWARDGLTNEQIAHNMGVNPDTLYKYINKYPEIAETLKKSKEVTDIVVENALYNNAIGYEYTEQKVVMRNRVEYEDGKRVLAETYPEVVDVICYKQPETIAQIFWLKNRKPKTWRDKQEVEHSGNINNPFEGLSTEELRELIKNEK